MSDPRWNGIAILMAITHLSLAMPTERAEADETPKFVEKVVAGIFIGISSIGNTRALVGYGTNIQRDGKQGLCYQHPENGEHLTIIFNAKTNRAETVEISGKREKGCKVLKEGFPSFFTAKGIRLGMKFKKTLPTYGNPHKLFIDKITEDEMSFILVNHPGSYIPEDGKDGEGPYIKVDIPTELSSKDFYRAYGQPEKIVGVHKTVVYSYHTDHEKVPSVKKFYDLELHVLKRRVVKIVVHDGE